MEYSISITSNISHGSILPSSIHVALQRWDTPLSGPNLILKLAGQNILILKLAGPILILKLAGQKNCPLFNIKVSGTKKYGLVVMDKVFVRMR